MVTAVGTPRAWRRWNWVSVCSRNRSCQPPISSTGTSILSSVSARAMFSQNGSVPSGWLSHDSYQVAPEPRSRRAAAPAGACMWVRATRRGARSRRMPTVHRGSSWCAIMSLQPRKLSSVNAPVPQVDSAKSWGATLMIAAFSSGGGSVSSAHWVKPRYDSPMVAKDPVNHGWSRNQAAVSTASAISLTIGSNSPPEPNVPRTLCTSTW
ncbi:hypothetical protein MAUB1S_05092 [Mycolicibacterium aubagnense]